VRLFNRLAVALVALVAGVSTAQLFRDTPDLDVTTEAVTEGPIIRRMAATGALHPISTVEVMADIPGIVSSIETENDTVVHAGQILARLDVTPYETALVEAKTSLAQARADRDIFQAAEEDARRALSRAEMLSEEGLVTEAALSGVAARLAGTQTDLEQADVRVSQAEALVDRAAINLSQTAVRAPADGLLVSTDVVRGQSVANEGKSRVLFHIATDLTSLQITTQLDRADAETLRTGDPAVVRIDGEVGASHAGTVSEIVPLGDASSFRSTLDGPGEKESGARSQVLIDIRSRGERLHPGLTATIYLDGTHGARVTRIPNHAFAFRPPARLLESIGQTRVPSFAAAETSDEPAAQVWGFNGTEFAAIAVRTGLADDRWTELVDGPVSPGDHLVTSAAPRHAGR
jgi:HlyD family secretion protein